MKKIVIISPEIPYPIFKGNQNRIDQTIKLLIDIGYQVNLICLNSSQRERKSISISQDIMSAYPGINSIEVRRHPKMLSGGFELVKYKLQKWLEKKKDRNEFSNVEVCPGNFKKTCHKAIKTIAPDIVIVNYIKMTDCIPSFFKGEKVIDLHDIQTNIFKEGCKQKGTNLPKNKYFKLLSDEIHTISLYDKIISINHNETRFLSDYVDNSKLFTLPAFSQKNKRIKIIEKYDVMFVGSASPFNVEGAMKFIAKVMPIVKRKIPNIKVAIAGDVSTCSALKKVNEDCYHMLGRVDSLSELYSSSKVVVSPIISGAGMKVKNVEALSYGMPIVATTFSMDGIFVKNNHSALLADDWVNFAEKLVLLLSNDILRKKISNEAESFFDENHSYDSAKEFYHLLLEGRSSEIQSKLFIRPLYVGENNNHSNNETPKPKKSRTKALIFSTDAYELISLNLFLAREMNNINIYSEFVRMESHGENVFHNDGFVAHSIRKQFSPQKRKKFKKEVSKSINKNGDFNSMIFYGVDISDDIRIYQKMFPEHFKKPIVDVLTHGLLILDTLIDLINKISPSFLVGWNGNGPHLIFLMKIAAKIKSLPIFHIERGLLPNSIVFDSQGVNFKSVFAGSYLPLINEIEKKKANEFIFNFRENKKSIVNISEQLNLTQRDIVNKFKLNSDRFLFFPMQIEGDSNIILNSPYYKKMIDVIKDLAFVAKETDIRIICRPHPENKNSLHEIIDEFSSNPFVFFDTDVNLHSMIKASFATVVINSTVGLESLLYGMPTIALGCSLYSHKGLTYDCGNKEHIINALKIIENNNLYDFVRHERLERLVHLMIFDYLLFLDGNTSGYGNRDKILAMLARNKIFPEMNLSRPDLPQIALKYKEEKDSAFNYLSNQKEIKIKNQLVDGTVQYLNGSKKPEVTETLISEIIKKKLNKKSVFVDDFEQSDVVIVNSDRFLGNKDKYKNKILFDEFLEFIS
jgi:glycosyltransferase involved in cell wall biosynthesis